MAQIRDSDKRHRSKEIIARDIAFILNAPVSYGTKYAVLAEVTWVWTEFDGKHKGCSYWSVEALKLPVNGIGKQTIHEHVVPKRVVIEKLFALQKPTETEVYELLNKFLISIIVKKAEDRRLNLAGFNNKMPAEFDHPEHEDYHNPWLRYKKCNIEWRNCRMPESQ